MPLIRRCTALLAVPLIGIAPLHSQTAPPPPGDSVLGVVDTIIVAGNEKTKTYVILDEMTLKPGSLATPDAIQYDRNRIYSLGLFTSVDIMYDSLGTTRFLFVDVRERWYLIPVPILGFRDGDPKKPFYGGGLLHSNFRGRNQKLYGSVVLGFDPSLSFSFTDPMFDREHAISFGTALSTGTVRNRSLVESALTGDFDERHFDISLSAGKRFTLFHTGLASFGIHSVHIADYRKGRTVSTDGNDIYLYATVGLTFDSRDLREYATRGSMLSVYLTKNGLGESEVDFSRFELDARHYVPLPADFSLAGRIHGTVVSGTVVPTYARAYFGAGERIRGYYQTLWEGENLAGGTLELRYALLKPRVFVFSAVPIPPEFAVWRFGVSLALFTDTGVAWFRHQKIRPDDFATGYGSGIHFLLPYGFVMRTEYAWNLEGMGQFIIDLRTSL
ncbi:MAG: POTRA domain-containing protein [Bacteroidota bacterium]